MAFDFDNSAPFPNHSKTCDFDTFYITYGVSHVQVIQSWISQRRKWIQSTTAGRWLLQISGYSKNIRVFLVFPCWFNNISNNYEIVFAMS